MAELQPATVAELHLQNYECPRCEHWAKVMDRFGREVYRQCPEPIADTFEGYGFCALHMPPGPKAA